MRTRTYLILWTALVIGVVLVVVLAGCSSEPKGTSDFQLTATANALYNTTSAGSGKSSKYIAAVSNAGHNVATVYANMTTTAMPSRPKSIPTGAGGSNSGIPNPPRPDARSTNPKAVPIPKPTVDKEEGWSNPETAAKYILATAAAENPAPTPTGVLETYSGVHAGIKADEAIANIKNYLRERTFQDSVLVSIPLTPTLDNQFRRQRYTYKAVTKKCSSKIVLRETNWFATPLSESSWLITAQVSDYTYGWQFYVATSAILPWPNDSTGDC